MEDIQAIPSITSHTFAETISNRPITFHVLKLNNSVFIWIGDSGRLDTLSVAMTTPYSPLPTPTPLLGLATEGDNSSTLAARLSKRTGKQVFASCGLDESVMVGVTKRLMQELTDFPEKF